jgi:hypothetical protein
MVPWPPLPMGSGGRGRVLSVRMLSVGWGGGQPSVGLVLELPAALMHGPMMGSAHQDQVVQVGGAAIQPVLDVVGLAPGQGAVTAGEDTAAVAHGQGGPLGGLDDSGGPADVQGLAGGPTQDRGQPPGRGLELVGQGCLAVGVVVAVVAAGVVVVAVVAGGLAGDQDSGQRAVTGQPLTGLR